MKPSSRKETCLEECPRPYIEDNYQYYCTCSLNTGHDGPHIAYEAHDRKRNILITWGTWTEMHRHNVLKSLDKILETS